MLPATLTTSARHCVVQHFAGSYPKEQPPPKGTYRLTFAVRVRCGSLQIFKRNYGYVDCIQDTVQGTPSWQCENGTSQG